MFVEPVAKKPAAKPKQNKKKTENEEEQAVIEEATDNGGSDSNEEAIESLAAMRKNKRQRQPLKEDLLQKKITEQPQLEAAPATEDESVIDPVTPPVKPVRRPAKDKGVGAKAKGKSAAPKDPEVSGVVPLTGLAANDPAEELLDEDFFEAAPKRARKQRKVPAGDIPDNRVSNIQG